jgi:hypothetical protein
MRYHEIVLTALATAITLFHHSYERKIKAKI